VENKESNRLITENGKGVDVMLTAGDPIRVYLG